MKRCPNCEFIYEDEQSVCDMDGHSLVHEGSLVNPQPLNSSSVKSPKPSTSRGVALPAGAGLLMALLFSVGYYASTEPGNSNAAAEPLQGAIKQFDINSPLQDNSLSSRAIASVSSVETVAPTSVASPTADAELDPPQNDANKPTHAHFQKTDARLSIARGVPPLPRLRPLPRLSEARPLDSGTTSAQTVRRSERGKQKLSATDQKDSKLGALLKKTGRVISKPFRL